MCAAPAFDQPGQVKFDQVMAQNDFLLRPRGLQQLDCSLNDAAISSLFHQTIVTSVDPHGRKKKDLASVCTQGFFAWLDAKLCGWDRRHAARLDVNRDKPGFRIIRAACQVRLEGFEKASGFRVGSRTGGFDTW